MTEVEKTCQVYYTKVMFTFMCIYNNKYLRNYLLFR